MYRVGLGQDSHQFEKNKTKQLILGGVKISNKGGLQAQSDGDVILHSLCNALSSAVGGDSLSAWADRMFFDKEIKDSKIYVRYILEKIKKQKYRIENISISVEAKTPRLSSEIIKKIKNRIAELLKIKIGQIGITFTSGEEITPFGQGKGIQALTVVNLKKND